MYCLLGIAPFCVLWFVLFAEWGGVGTGGATGRQPHG